MTGRPLATECATEVADADPEDLVLFDDLLGIADPNTPLPAIDPDARRRRLTALVNAASLARESPAVYVVEDAHWIDEVSESMLAEFFTVIPQTPSLVLVTYRPEYRGALTLVAGAQTIALAPLSDSETAALVTELLGPDPSVGALGQTIAERAAGNPFFAEEIVRELAERGVLRGQPGAYISTAEAAEVNVPATLQATIAARIDRLDPKAKRTLSAAAVIGSRFGLDLLTVLGVEPVVADLVAAQLIDQVRFTRQAEYVFHHPLIRAVAYEAQLKSDRAELHRRLAVAIEQREPDSLDENAALIAEHLEAAGDLHAAFGWHMRAATWSANRDIMAARVSWQRAQQVADRLPVDDPDRISMRIAPRTLLCGTAWRVSGSFARTGFDELQDLAAAAGDKVSLAIGMAGLLMTQALNREHRQSSRLASEYTGLLESIGDSALTVGLSFVAMTAKFFAGEMSETLRLAQRAIDLADGDPIKGNLIVGSPLAMAIDCRGSARWALGLPGWRNDFDQAIAMAGAVDPVLQVLLTIDFYTLAFSNGALLPDAPALRDSAEALAIAERSGDDSALLSARGARGIVLVHQDGPERKHGFDLLAQVREAARQERFSTMMVPIVDIQTAKREGPHRRSRRCHRPVPGRHRRPVRLRLDDFSRAAHQRLGGGTAAPRVRRRPRRRAGRDRPAGSRADRTRIRPTRAATLADAGIAGQGARRRGRATATIGIATATWRERLALRGISPGPRRCHDGCREASALQFADQGSDLFGARVVDDFVSHLESF